MGGHFECGLEHLGVAADGGSFGEFLAGLESHAADFGGEEFFADVSLDGGVLEGADGSELECFYLGDEESAAVFDDFGDLAGLGAEDGLLDFFQGEGAAVDFADVSASAGESVVVVGGGGEGEEVFAVGGAVAQAGDAVEGGLLAAVAGGVDTDEAEGGGGLLGEDLVDVFPVKAAHVAGGGVGNAGSDLFFVVDTDEEAAVFTVDHFLEVFAGFEGDAFGVFERAAGVEDEALAEVGGEGVGEFTVVGSEVALGGGVFEFF